MGALSSSVFAYGPTAVPRAPRRLFYLPVHLDQPFSSAGADAVRAVACAVAASAKVRFVRGELPTAPAPRRVTRQGASPACVPRGHGEGLRWPDHAPTFPRAPSPTWLSPSKPWATKRQSPG